MRPSRRAKARAIRPRQTPGARVRALKRTGPTHLQHGRVLDRGEYDIFAHLEAQTQLANSISPLGAIIMGWGEKGPPLFYENSTLKIVDTDRSRPDQARHHTLVGRVNAQGDGVGEGREVAIGGKRGCERTGDEYQWERARYAMGGEIAY